MLLRHGICRQEAGFTYKNKLKSCPKLLPCKLIYIVQKILFQYWLR
jgi:hypothetical protein